MFQMQLTNFPTGTAGFTNANTGQLQLYLKMLQQELKGALECGCLYQQVCKCNRYEASTGIVKAQINGFC